VQNWAVLSSCCTILHLRLLVLAHDRTAELPNAGKCRTVNLLTISRLLSTSIWNLNWLIVPKWLDTCGQPGCPQHPLTRLRLLLVHLVYHRLWEWCLWGTRGSVPSESFPSSGRGSTSHPRHCPMQILEDLRDVWTSAPEMIMSHVTYGKTISTASLFEGLGKSVTWKISSLNLRSCRHCHQFMSAGHGELCTRSSPWRILKLLKPEGIERQFDASEFDKSYSLRNGRGLERGSFVDQIFKW